MDQTLYTILLLAGAVDLGLCGVGLAKILQRMSEENEMAKSYPLEINELREVEGSNEPIGFYTKGHHPSRAFWKALHEKYPDHAEHMNKKSVVQAYWRVIPWAGSDPCYLAEAAGPGRGAFPVTAVMMEVV